METITALPPDVQPDGVVLAVYEGVVEDLFDPGAGPYHPWTLRGALAMVTGRDDVTAWTREHAVQLAALLTPQPKDIHNG